MKKDRFLWIVLDAIVLIVFNTLFFLLTEHPATARDAAAAAGSPVIETFKYRRELGSVWLSYIFIHISYIAVIITPFITRGSKTSKAILSASIYAISSVYFFIQFALGLIFIFVKLNDYKVALVIFVILFGLYAIILLAFLIINEKTSKAEEKRSPMIAYVKNASARLQIVLEQIDDDDAAKAVCMVRDAISASPVKSHPDLADIEYYIFQSIDKIEAAVEEKNIDNVIELANNLVLTVKERNSKLRQYN